MSTMDPIVLLDVGGQMFRTRKSTLATQDDGFFRKFRQGAAGEAQQQGHGQAGGGEQFNDLHVIPPSRIIGSGERWLRPCR